MSQVNMPTEEKIEMVQASDRPISSCATSVLVSVPAPGTTIPVLLVLPMDIMSRIIDLGAHDDVQGFPLLASHICRDLRHLTLSTPKLWSSLYFVGGISSHQELVIRLSRAQGAPIDVSISNLETFEDAEWVLKYLVPHVSRWHSFHLTIARLDVAEMVMKALPEEAPILESISLIGTTGSVFNPFDGQAPLLKRLFIEHAHLAWDAPMFQNVRSLHLQSTSWTSTPVLTNCQALNELTIRADSLHPLIFMFNDTRITLPHLHCLELNGISENDIVQILSHIELPALTRVLFTHIIESTEPIVDRIIPLPNLQQLRLHAAEISRAILLKVLKKVRNLKIMSFEDPTPIPQFIHELTPRQDFDSWIIPNVTEFKITAFEKDNVLQDYDDTDIAEAFRQMMFRRREFRGIEIRMCVFKGNRDNETQHAAEWNEEREYKSVYLINLT